MITKKDGISWDGILSKVSVLAFRACLAAAHVGFDEKKAPDDCSDGAEVS
jgi:hypothetical protein